jgi:hypothetical protein
MRQADTDKNRHRPRVVLPKDECKKGGYYDDERASGRWLFFYLMARSLTSRAKFPHYITFQYFRQVKNYTNF